MKINPGISKVKIIRSAKESKIKGSNCEEQDQQITFAGSDRPPRSDKKDSAYDKKTKIKLSASPQQTHQETQEIAERFAVSCRSLGSKTYLGSSDGKFLDDFYDPETNNVCLKAKTPPVGEA